MRTDDFRLDQLRQAVGELAESDVSSLSDGEVRERLPVLLSALGTLGAVLAETVASFDTRELAEADGCRSVRAWLMAFGRMSAQSATGWLERGRLLGQLPGLAAAARGGAVSTEHLRKVGDLVERHGIAEVVRFDGVLGELAAAGTPADVQKACERISAHLDPDGPDPENDFQRRGLTLSRAGSMVGLRGQLDAEAGAAVLTALDALMAPPGPDDVRTARQRRADALAELARQSLSRGELPTVGGVRPTVGILLQPGNLRGPGSAPAPNNPLPCNPLPSNPLAPSDPLPPSDPLAPSALAPSSLGSGRATPSTGPHVAAGLAAPSEPAHLSWFGAVPDELAQRIACDCDVWRAVLDPATGLPLELGRTHRLVPHWLRKALHARDRGCRWPGCGAPVAWTDAHHLRAWYDGGPTDVDNLLCLCRFHHGKVHEGRWRIQLDRATGQVHVTRPDGRPYELGPSRPWTPGPPDDPLRRKAA